MKIILDKIERISISIAILIFASGCFIQGGSFLLPAFFIAGMLGIWVQERIRKRKAGVKSRIGRHAVVMSGADCIQACSVVGASDGADGISTHHMGDRQHSWMSMDSGTYEPSTMFDIGSSHACNIDGSPMCGSTDIHGNPYGVT